GLSAPSPRICLCKSCGLSAAIPCAAQRANLRNANSRASQYAWAKKQRKEEEKNGALCRDLFDFAVKILVFYKDTAEQPVSPLHPTDFPGFGTSPDANAITPAMYFHLFHILFKHIPQRLIQGFEQGFVQRLLNCVGYGLVQGRRKILGKAAQNSARFIVCSGNLRLEKLINFNIKHVCKFYQS
ncbi:MAG: hypothetical protein LBK13_00930, partial [Spirochaetales bacterium]|nr:hypothetical protein [Spirochaetales bacterium]